MRKHVAVGVFALALAGVPGLASAQGSLLEVPVAPSPWYFGIGMSKNVSTIPESTIRGLDTAVATQLRAPPYSITIGRVVIDENKIKSGAKIYLGYAFNSYLALEGGYFPEAISTADYTYYNGVVPVSTFTLRYKTEAFFLDAVGSFPLGGKLSVLARAGASVGRTKVSSVGSHVQLVGSSAALEETKTRLKLGAGLQYDFLPELFGRAEFEHYRFADPLGTEKVKLNAFTASLNFRF
jgi:OmpA-OmpF porin, OOP family